MSVAWPCPVSASEPNSSQVMLSMSERIDARSAKSRAARIGPTVCELDGPIPIVKRSVMLIACVSGSDTVIDMGRDHRLEGRGL